MKSIYTFLFILISAIGYSQTVTTILDSPTADVDDALVFDSRGNLYDSNWAGSTVYKITRSGQVTEFITDLEHPNGLAFDSKGNLFVAEWGTGAIRKYNKNGMLLQSYQIGTIATVSGLIKAYRSDNVIYTDPTNNSVNELFPDGTIKTLYDGPLLDGPVGLAYDRRGNLYFGNYTNRKIYRLNFKRGNVIGEPTYIATVPDSGTDFPFLAFIAYTNGFLYGTVYGEHKVYKINPRATDEVEVFAGSTYGNADGDISEATFAYPAGIVASKSGRALFISEFSGFGNIRMISAPKNVQNLDESENEAGNEDCDFGLKLNLYPNPVSELLKVQLQLDNELNVTIRIYNNSGRLVFQNNENIKKGYSNMNIPVKGWTAGFYNIVVSNGKCTESKKVIVVNN